MPIALTAARLLARAVGISARAHLLADLVSDHELKGECAAIELDASNVRTMLADTLRGSADASDVLIDIDRRLRQRGTQLDAIERARIES